MVVVESLILQKREKNLIPAVIYCVYTSGRPSRDKLTQLPVVLDPVKEMHDRHNITSMCTKLDLLVSRKYLRLYY